MTQNYRSGKEIVRHANSFINRNRGRFNKTISANREFDGTVRVIDITTRNNQWRTAFKQIKKHDGKLAVIYRNNDAAIPLVDMLLRNDMPFNLLKGKKTFFDSSIAKDIRAFFELALNPWDKESFKRVYWKTNLYICKEDADWACKNTKRNGSNVFEALLRQMKKYRKREQVNADVGKAKRLRKMIIELVDMTPTDAIDSLMEGNYGNYLYENDIPTDKVDVLRELSLSEGSLKGFLERLDYLDGQFMGKSVSQAKDAVTLTSAHSCKGLEFDSVLIFDAYDGTFPSTKGSLLSSSKDNADQYQEERRLFYVAMTRAKSELVFMRILDRETSFIDEIIPRAKIESASDADQKMEIIQTKSSSSISENSNVREKSTHKKRIKRRLPSPAYNIELWDTVEYDSPGRKLVSNGRIYAMVSDAFGKRALDLEIVFEPVVMDEVLMNIGELAYSSDIVSLCLSMETSQKATAVLCNADQNGFTTLCMNNREAIRCLKLASKLFEQGVGLTATFMDPDGEFVGKYIERIDIENNCIELSEENLEIF